MIREEQNAHLSQITTVWKDLAQAHGGAAPAISAAQQRLLRRYAPAVKSYLLAAARDHDAADELFQEFALRLLRGAFKHVHPGRGRFRDYLKAALCHLVVDHQRHRRGNHRPLPEEVPDPHPPQPPCDEADRTFLTAWRNELMQTALQALHDFERRSGQPLFLVLDCRLEYPEMPAAEMAGRLAARLGRPLTAEWVHKRLHLARQKLADLLVEEAARTLADPSEEDLAEELSDLELLDRCQAALGRWRRGRCGSTAGCC